MRRTCEFYICPVCFTTSDQPGIHHNHEMIFCQQLPVGDDLLKPVRNLEGDLKSRAPRWFLEAVWEAANLDFKTVA